MTKTYQIQAEVALTRTIWFTVEAENEESAKAIAESSASSAHFVNSFANFETNDDRINGINIIEVEEEN